MLIESFRNKCILKKGLSDKFFEKYSEDQLSGPDSLSGIEAFLKKELAENNIQKAISKWNELELCARGSGELVEWRPLSIISIRPSQ